MTTRFARRASRCLLATLTIYVLLVATHDGEFWPFSIFPMFSQAGQPWTRAVVREMPAETSPDHVWRRVTLDELPGRPLPLDGLGVNPNDVANFVSKTDTWDIRRLKGLNRLLDASSADSPLLVYRVRGRLNENTVQTTATPLILFTSDTTFTAPSLKTFPLD